MFRPIDLRVNEYLSYRVELCQHAANIVVLVSHGRVVSLQHVPRMRGDDDGAQVVTRR